MGQISLNNVTKTFGNDDIVAVQHLPLEIKDGEFLVLVGPSGCGKSTTLRMIAGLESVTEGDVTIGNTRVNSLPPRQREIAMVFQNYALYPHMSVRENMGFGLKLSTEMSSEEIDDRVREAAEMMDIEDLLGDKPKQLSGGQQQRVALGRAIVREPEAFLFDEPLSNLDAKLRTQMRTEISRIQNELDVTSVYVTHDQAEAMTMGDRIAVMNDGELQQVGRPNEVYDHPTNRFVAGFIGSPSMNFISMTLEGIDGGYELRAEDTALSYRLESSLVEQLDLTGGESLTLGVRPEDVRLADDAGDEDDRIQEASVNVVEPMGSDNFLYLSVGSSTWTARVDSSIEPDVGETVRYTFDPTALHLFDVDGNTLKSQGDSGASVHQEVVEA
jgi:multiple sugar transport system ATP-binding protein